MEKEINEIANTDEKGKTKDPAGKIATVAWGLFFVWVGIAMLATINTGISLLGIGLITVSTQLVRKYFGLTFEGFWLAVGIIFSLGGIWALFDVQIPFVPVALLVGGLLLIISVFGRKN